MAARKNRRRNPDVDKPRVTEAVPASNEKAGIRQPGSKTYRLACLVFLAAAFVYLNILPNPFLYDDEFYILNNPYIQDPSNFLKIWTLNYTPQTQGWGIYRPFTSLTYLADYTLYGLNPRGFHLTNLLAHAISSVLFFYVAARFLRSSIAGLFAGLLFAVHPVHTEAVAWAVGRAEILSGLWCMAALLLYERWDRSGRPGWGAACCAAYFLALSSKEIAAPLPLIFLLRDGLIEGIRGRDWIRKIGSRYLWFIVPFGLYLVLRANALGGLGINPVFAAYAGPMAPARFPTAIYVLFKYLVLSIIPVGLRVEYDFPLKTGFLDSIVLLSLVVIFASLAAAWVWRKRCPEAAFCIGWFWIFLLPVSNLLFQSGAIIGERFLYIPSAAMALGIGILALLAARHKPANLRSVEALILIVFVIFSFMTMARNRDWKEPRRFWEKTLALSPNGHKANFNYGNILADEGEKEQAVQHYRRAIAAKGDQALYYNGLGKALMALEMKDEARQAYDQALQIDPHLKYALFNMGNWYLDRGEFKKALEYYEKGRVEGYDTAALYNNMGQVYMQGKEYDRAIANYQKALEKDPSLPQPMVNIGAALIDAGRYREAVTYLEEILRIHPNLAEARDNLNIARERMRNEGAEVEKSDLASLFKSAKEALLAGKISEATRMFSQVVDNVQSGTGEIYFSWGLTNEGAGRKGDAIAAYRHAVQLAPKLVEAQVNLANLLREQGSLEEAMSEYRKALEVRPDFANAHYNYALCFIARNSDGDSVKAEDEFKAAIHFDPEHPYAYTALGQLYARKGTVEEAIKMFTKAIEVAPNEPFTDRARQYLANQGHGIEENH